MNPIRAERRGRAVGRSRTGNATVEFALIAPVLLVLFIATAEAVNYLRLWYRIEQAATSAAQAGSRLEVLNRNAVEGLFATAQAVADPFPAWNVTPTQVRARTVISVVSNPQNGNEVAWTCSRGDTTLAARVAGTSNLPASFTVPPGQSVLVVEIVNTGVPWLIMAAPIFFGTRGPPNIRAYTVVRPRSAELRSLTGGCP